MTVNGNSSSTQQYLKMISINQTLVSKLLLPASVLKKSVCKRRTTVYFVRQACAMNSCNGGWQRDGMGMSLAKWEQRVSGKNQE